MTQMNGVFTPEQVEHLHQQGMTAFGKRVHARIERNTGRSDTIRYLTASAMPSSSSTTAPSP